MENEILNVFKEFDKEQLSKKDDDYKHFDGKHISIKAKRDDGYKQQTAIEKPIYINQGDIVDYFERNSLKELAEKSNKVK